MPHALKAQVDSRWSCAPCLYHQNHMQNYKNDDVRIPMTRKLSIIETVVVAMHGSGVFATAMPASYSYCLIVRYGGGGLAVAAVRETSLARPLVY
eukprot:3111631-Amphidinium_carterae.1